jgi:PAS domain S-box-containing protein
MQVLSRALKEAQAELQEKDQQLRAALEHSSEYTIVLVPERDATGAISDWIYQSANSRMLSMAGMTREGLLGRKMSEVTPERSAELAAMCSRVLETGETSRYEVKFKGRDLFVTLFAMGSNAVVSSSIDVTQLNATLARLQEDELRLRQVLALLPVGVYLVKAPAGEITYFNQQAADLWGRSPSPGDTDERFCGSYRLWMPDGSPLPHDRTPMAQALYEGQSCRNLHVVIERPPPDSSRITVLVNIEPIFDARGRVIGAINVFHDVTSQHQAEQSIREADRRKDEFLATLAHELRNPMAPIRTGLQIMKLASRGDEAADACREMMERQVAHMARLVDDLMDISRVSTGTIVLQRTKLLLVDALRDAVETAHPLLVERNHELTFQLPSEPIYVNGDRTRLAQVFTNILKNAATYTEDGGRIRLAVEREDNEVMVSVVDNGMGIEQPLLSRVFDMFVQKESSMRGAAGGLGIGLNISKRLVELHGGTIVAESEGHGKGSRFIVRLEIASSMANPARTMPAESARPLVRRRILIADDNRDATSSLELLLEMMGHETWTAHDGLEAIEAAAAYQPDIILLDIGMPRMDGFEVCRQIRQQPWGKAIVIIACTGWGLETDRRRSTEAGFDFHLVKPIDPASLEKLLTISP